MKTSHCYLPCLLLLAMVFAGCESSGISNRINERSSIFNSLTAKQKSDIKDGIVLPGYTKDMAYMAFGSPSSMENKERKGLSMEMWAYKKFYPSGRMADILTEVSRARNPNLNRSLNLQSGGATVNSNAPRSGGGVGTATGSGNNLSLPDLPVYNLYVFFVKGKVVDIKVESLDGTKF